MYWNPYYSYLNQIVHGTAGDDMFWLYRHEHTNVRTYDGDDEIELYGTATYTVDAGDGSDKIAVATSGVVEVDAGDGADTVIVSTLANHDLDGGASYDRLKFGGLHIGVEVDLAEGTVTSINGGASEMKISNFEFIYGSSHRDKMVGDDQTNRFYGEDGDDLIYAGGGNDVLSGGHGQDSISGEEGDDVIFGGSGADTLRGGDGNDRIYGGKGDEIEGGDGDDRIYANNENHGEGTVNSSVKVWDGAGDDIVWGNRAPGYYTFGEGADTFYGRSEVSAVDHVIVRTDKDTDTFYGGGGTSNYEGTSDRLDYTKATGRVDIDAERGTVKGDGVGGATLENNGDSWIYTIHKDVFSGFQNFVGSEYDDTFRGSDDADVKEWFSGDQGADVFFGSKGQDNFNGGMHRVGSSDFAEPDGEHNEVSYERFDGRVTVNLGTGEGTARDIATWEIWDHTYVNIQGITGSRYADTLIGDENDNRIDGERGNDQLTGGDGADAFVFNGMAYDNGYDVIQDFETGVDVIELVHMKGTDGQSIDGFGDLDTNGDGVLNSDDATLHTGTHDSLLMTGDGLMLLMNVTELSAEDFMFV